jgi:hypothetical protein
MIGNLIEFTILLAVLVVWATVLGLAGMAVLRLANWIAGLIDRR